MALAFSMQAEISTTKKNEEKNGTNWSLSNVGFDSLIPKFKGF